MLTRVCIVFRSPRWLRLATFCTGNYRNGALKEGVLDCDHNKQFDEKRCRTLLESPKSACGGAVMLRHLNGNPSLGDVCEAPIPGNLTLWSIGSHQISYERKDIVSVNSVPHHVAFMQNESGICPWAAAHTAHCRLWWYAPERLELCAPLLWHTCAGARLGCSGTAGSPRTQRLNHRPFHPTLENHTTIRRCCTAPP